MDAWTCNPRNRWLGDLPINNMICWGKHLRQQKLGCKSCQQKPMESKFWSFNGLIWKVNPNPAIECYWYFDPCFQHLLDDIGSKDIYQNDKGSCRNLGLVPPIFEFTSNLNQKLELTHGISPNKRLVGHKFKVSLCDISIPFPEPGESPGTNGWPPVETRGAFVGEPSKMRWVL